MYTDVESPSSIMYPYGLGFVIYGFSGSKTLSFLLLIIIQMFIQTRDEIEEVNKDYQYQSSFNIDHVDFQDDIPPGYIK